MKKILGLVSALAVSCVFFVGATPAQAEGSKWVAPSEKCGRGVACPTCAVCEAAGGFCGGPCPKGGIWCM